MNLPAAVPRRADWAPCSDLSYTRADPLPGTAGLGQRWLLVEIDSGWGRHAFLDSALDPAVGRSLVDRAERAGIRPVAIRRFARRADDRRQARGTRWMLADARPGRESILGGTVADPADLLALPLDASAGTALAGPLALVCTHARHDQCCAVRGRPVAAALTAAVPEQTWESSHLGGDRFAPTVLLLPWGLLYGRVPAAEAPLLVELARRGEVDARHLRGRTCYPSAVQAAQAAVRAETGEARIDAYRPVQDDPAPDGRVVTLDAGERTVTVRLRETWSEALFSTCAATAAAPVREWQTASIVWHGP